MNKIISEEFICYGNGNTFDINKFQPIKNQDWIKPEGGLWATPINSEWGWKQWCEAEEFMLENLLVSFTFTFNGKLFIIDKVSDAAKLPWRKNPMYKDNEYSFLHKYPDFEKISKKYDGILLTVRGERETRYNKEYSLYGWDCESLLILNSKAIIIKKNPLLRDINI